MFSVRVILPDPKDKDKDIIVSFGGGIYSNSKILPLKTVL